MDKPKTFHVWITQYALSQGIYERTVESTYTPTMVAFRRRQGTCYGEYYHKPDWHLTRAEAIARADDIRMREIASLEKQLAKLKAMKFE